MAVYIISDLHFGHENLIKRYRGFSSIEEHDQMIISNWNKVIKKKDRVYLLGDLSIEKNVSEQIKQLNGIITIIGGNHDKPNHLIEYLKLPNVINIAGIVKYKGYWLTHAPIHSKELRGNKNIHGHTHKGKIKTWYGLLDKRYINACVDVNGFTPIEFTELIKNKQKICY